MKHPLDFSAPRISDLSLDDRRAAMLARDAGRREAYQRQMDARIARDAQPAPRLLRMIGIGK